MKTFDWGKFKLGGIAVHCKTEQECDNFLKMYKVVPQNRKNYFSQLGGDICYSIDFDKRLMYYTVSYCDDRGDTILEWSDYMKFTKEDLKVGMLVETEFGMSLVMNYKAGNVLSYRSGAFEKWGNIESCGIKKVWDICEDPVYVFDFSGCGRNVIYDRTQTKEMTVEEVSKALGYDVKIVKG